MEDILHASPIYIKGVSEKPGRTFNKYDVSLYFKHANLLRQLLVHTKDKLHKEERVVGPVYYIVCETLHELTMTYLNYPICNSFQLAATLSFIILPAGTPVGR